MYLAIAAPEQVPNPCDVDPIDHLCSPYSVVFLLTPLPFQEIDQLPSSATLSEIVASE